MKTRTNYIRWNRDMERKCLGSIWPSRSSGSKKNVSKTGNKEENDIKNEILLEENKCINLEGSETVCEDKDISLDISEGIQENLEENISEDTDNMSLKAFMENAIKENEIQKTKIYDNPKKISWNENMVKRCFGSYLGISQGAGKYNKKWAKKDSGVADEEAVENRSQVINNEPSEDVVPQDDHMLDAQLYDGEVVEEIKKAVGRKKRRRNKGSKAKSGTNKGYDELSYEASLQNLWVDEGKAFEEDDCSDCAKSYEQEDMGNFQKISWSVIDESEEQKEVSESVENVYNESNDVAGNDSNDENKAYVMDSSWIKDETEVKENFTYEDNIAEDDSYIQEDYFTEDSTNNEMTNELNFITGDIFEIEPSGIEVEESQDYSVFDLEDSDSIDTLELEITNKTIESMDWDSNWDEYELMDNDTQEIETVDSFSDYGNSLAEDIEFSFNYESEVVSPEYSVNFGDNSYGQSVECRIVT